MNDRHENRDIRTRALLLVVAALCGTVVIVAGALFMYYRSTGLVAGAGLEDWRPGERRGARLEISPAASLETLHREQHARLSSYGWIDQERKIVHIPIEEAAGLLARRREALVVQGVEAP